MGDLYFYTGSVQEELRIVMYSVRYQLVLKKEGTLLKTAQPDSRKSTDKLTVGWL